MQDTGRESEMSKTNGVFDEEVEGKIILNYASDTLSTVLQFDHIDELFASPEYQKLVSKGPGMISNLVMNHYDRKTMKLLEFAEQTGYLDDVTRRMFEEDAKKTKKRIGFGTRIMTDITLRELPVLYQLLDDKINGKNMRRFLISWMGYINGAKSDSPILTSNIKSIYDAFGIQASNEYIEDKLSQTATLKFSELPQLNRINKRRLNKVENEQLLKVAKLIIANSELTDKNTRNRALQFMTEVFGVSYTGAESKLKEVESAQEYLEQLLLFSSVDYTCFFKPLAASANEALRFAEYDIKTHPDTKRQKENREKLDCIQNQEKDIKELGQPSLDVIRISEDMMMETLKPSKEQRDDYFDAKCKHREAYGYEGDDGDDT